MTIGHPQSDIDQPLRHELRALPVLACPPRPCDPDAAPDTPQMLFLDWIRAAMLPSQALTMSAETAY